jgi:hypothetical protein
MSIQAVEEILELQSRDQENILQTTEGSFDERNGFADNFPSDISPVEDDDDVTAIIQQMQARIDSPKPLSPQNPTSARNVPTTNAAPLVVVPVSKLKNKLQQLNGFVLKHTNRKILAFWSLIEAKFNSSQKQHTYTKRGEVSSTMDKAILLSDLIVLLCSQKVKIKNQELTNLCSAMEISTFHLQHSRKIAALKIILHIYHENGGVKREKSMAVELDLQVLMREKESFVCLGDLQQTVFSSDPAQQEEELRKVDIDRIKMLDEMIAEREKQKELKLRAENRILKAKTVST